MKKPFIIALAMLFTVALGAPAGAADTAATQIPFNLPVTVQGGTVTIPPQSAGSGFVGVCDVQLECYGASLLATESGGGASVGQTVVHLSGVICIHDQYAPCGSTGNPGTGLVITRRDVVTPPASVKVPAVRVELCTWRGDPRFSPRCVNTDAIANPSGPVELGSQDLQLFLGLMPDRIVVNTGR